ncbi:hypothetical protein ACFV4N_08300 [Actinosynnema sp. NPDC059797]
MTGTSPPTDQMIQLNHHAPHPPFAWYVSIPSTWALLDTNPTTWQLSLTRLVDERFAGRSLRAADRRAVTTFLEQLVADCQRAGTVLSMVQLGRMTTGQVGSAGLHLAWFNSGHQPAGLALVRESLPRSGTTEELTTPAGPALLHTDEASTVPPGGTLRVRSRVQQAYLPLPGTTWTAVLSAATPHPEMHTVLDEVLRAVITSIQPAQQDDEFPPPPHDTDDSSGPRAAVSGVEDGFGTMLRHRVDGDNAHE